MPDPTPSSAPSSSPASPAAPGVEKPKTNVKETLTSVIIAFVMAFVFRGFVIEGFVIPTGSMAPTLLGAHTRYRSDFTGYEWPIGPADGSSQAPPASHQRFQTLDPIIGTRIDVVQRVRAGDRLFVLKYLDGVFDPKRWDVPVFKYPMDPAQNYIKRLVGVPNEQLIFIDGDVFSRPVQTERRPGTREEAVAQGWSERDAQRGFRVTSGESEQGIEAWLSPGWQVRRKPERVQRTVWQFVFSSEYTPTYNGGPFDGFTSPWQPEGQGWDPKELQSQRAYTYSGETAGVLRWDARRPISDSYPYNVTAPYQNMLFAAFRVSDVRMRVGVRPEREGFVLGGAVTARGVTWEAQIGGGRVRLLQRSAEASQTWGEGEEVASAFSPAADLDPARVTNVEVWHVDQSVSVWIDGEKVLEHLYDWTPAERVLASTGHELGELLAQASPPELMNPLGDTSLYKQADVAWHLSGAAKLHRVALDRDLHYQIPAKERAGLTYYRGGHPMNFATLGPDDFFLCGDNSPNSYDSRMWTAIDPWISAQLYGTPEPDASLGVFGLVHRDLMVGRAFVVYFPAPVPTTKGLPWMDFGRLRWIW